MARRKCGVLRSGRQDHRRAPLCTRLPGKEDVPSEEVAMGETVTGKVKNVVLVGQGGVGKTMLAEAMLHLTGKTTRLGGHAGTKPTLD